VVVTLDEMPTIPPLSAVAKLITIEYVFVPGRFDPTIDATIVADAAPAKAKLATTAILRVASFRMSILLVFPVFPGFLVFLIFLAVFLARSVRAGS
jgi:hypothetical protein